MHQRISKKIFIYLFIFFILVTITNKKLSYNIYEVNEFKINGLNQLETEKLYDSLNEKNIIKIKPENIICILNNRCYSYANGRFIYLDDIHFGPDGTILIANEIIKDINLDNK